MEQTKPALFHWASLSINVDIFKKLRGTPTYIYEKWHCRINFEFPKEIIQVQRSEYKKAEVKWTEKANTVL